MWNKNIKCKLQYLLHNFADDPRDKKPIKVNIAVSDTLHAISNDFTFDIFFNQEIFTEILNNQLEHISLSIVYDFNHKLLEKHWVLKKSISTYRALLITYRNDLKLKRYF